MSSYLAREIARIIKLSESKEEAVFTILEHLNSSYYLINSFDADQFDEDLLSHHDKLSDDIVHQVVYAQQEGE